MPDVVVCDLGLPKTDGHEIVRTLRRDARFHGVLFVALSGHALPEDVERCEAAGFDHHVSKPPRIGELESVLCEAPRAGVPGGVAPARDQEPTPGGPKPTLYRGAG